MSSFWVFETESNLAQTGFELSMEPRPQIPNLLTSTSQMPGLQLYSITPGHYYAF